jgi:prepilin-type N-terminal cleavage/methylation domain-containing protein
MANCQSLVNRQLCQSPAPSRGARRRAFTLIELLVVISLILVLVGLLILFVPSALDSAKAADGATMLQQALQIARTRAIRDQRSYGLRLVADPTTGHVRQVHYIEQPDDFTGGMLYVGPDKTDPNWMITPKYIWVYLYGVDLQNGGPGTPNADTTTWSVLPGDYLEVFGSGKAQRIVGLPRLGASLPYASPPMPAYLMDPPFQLPGPTPPNYPILRAIEVAYYSGSPPTPVSLFAVETPFSADARIGSPPPGYPPTLLPYWSPIPFSSTPGATQPQSTATYRILRRPRLTGEEPLQLPNDVAIDGTMSKDGGGQALFTASAPTLDIVFASSGRVLFPRTSSDFIALWVRDVSLSADPFDGEPSIIGVYVRSGAVAAQDADRNSLDPYSFLRDGRSSGK